jgi:hypothetical protein
MWGFERICWILTILASIAAIAILGTALFGHQLAAPDQVVLAVAGAGIAIVPYIFTRAIQALGRDARRRAAVRSLPAALAPVAVSGDEPAPPETQPSLAPLEDPAPPRAEPAVELPAAVPVPEPPIGLVARERLVPPPPPPRRSALERAFWVLIGILVVIIVVGIILIRNGP